MIGLYIHVPFCVSKCAYCDFYSLPGQIALADAYVDAVLSEAASYPHMPFRTLYLGGGTPGLLGPRRLKKLMGGLRRCFDVSGVVEATIEVNPDSATHHLLHAARDIGINRVSVGVQSLSDPELESVGRVHHANQAIAALKLAGGLGFSVSADLIAGLPGQDWGSLQKSLEGVVGLGIDHLSLYCLSLEEGTPLHVNPPPTLPTDDQQAELFSRATALLAGWGFVHYEISNFALPGRQCAHNLNYWRGGEYLGLGPSAASHLDGKRFNNRPELHTYLENPTGLRQGVEQLSPPGKAAEEAMLRLRLLHEGLDIEQLKGKFGADNVAGLIERVEGLAVVGALVKNGPQYLLSPTRVLTSNPVLAGVL